MMEGEEGLQNSGRPMAGYDDPRARSLGRLRTTSITWEEVVIGYAWLV